MLIFHLSIFKAGSVHKHMNATCLHDLFVVHRLHCLFRPNRLDANLKQIERTKGKRAILRNASKACVSNTNRRIYTSI